MTHSVGTQERMCTGSQQASPMRELVQMHGRLVHFTILKDKKGRKGERLRERGTGKQREEAERALPAARTKSPF